MPLELSRTLRTLCALLSLSLAAGSPPRYPTWHSHACVAPNNAFPFCDTSLPVADRAADLVSRLTLTQKIDNRYDRESEVTALGLPDYNYNTEGLHGLGAMCLTINNYTRCATVFAAPPTIGAAFNVSLANAIGDAISTELRAMNNFGGNRDYQNRPLDLNIWLPNVNVARDPRYGRQVELFCEDPWAIGVIGSAMVRGAQEGAGAPAGNGYLKAIVAVKHATAYQVENNRFARNENITLHDLSDTFYPACECGAASRSEHLRIRTLYLHDIMPLCVLVLPS